MRGKLGKRLQNKQTERVQK